MHPTAEEFLEEFGERFDKRPEVKEFPEGTKTAEDAAEAIGCDLEQIVKSLVMKSEEGYYLVLCSGSNRVDPEEMAGNLGVEKVEMASPPEVKEKTGWSIGGVPPFADGMEVFVDRSLEDLEKLWAAAGTPEAVFEISPERLMEISGGEYRNFFD